jgi:hypothetical protein
MRDQSAGGDKENPGLPRLAVQTPANFLRRWQPLQFLNLTFPFFQRQIGGINRI